MILSVIICSRNSDISSALRENITATIGCEFELCVIDNTCKTYNICSAYNEGVKRTSGEILCFMHEDVWFHSDSWGKVVTDFFANIPEAGLLGVVGGQFMPNTPAYWGEGGNDYGVILQGNYDDDGVYHVYWAGNEFEGDVLEVAAVDGQWFCIPRELFKSIRFDDTTFTKFHSYDVDICMQIATSGKRLFISKQILVEHQSGGNDDLEFIEQNELFYNKWKSFFPLVRGAELSEKEITERTRIVKMKRYYWKQYLKVERELRGIRKSYAYRLGKALLFPLKVFRKTK